MVVYRRDFISSIGHELKTPIFAAQSYVHTLLDGASSDPEVLEKFLKRAAKSLDGLQELVEDFMDLSEMEAGVVSMRLAPINVGVLISDTIDLLEGLAEKRDVTIQWEKNSNKKEFILVDKKRMTQVLINLMENAVKYGREKGNIYLGAEADKDFVTISVRDDGPGIDQEHLKRIFERFYRVEQSRNRAKGGSGLGLAIVKHIIELHGSKVQVVSKLNKGTTFSFRVKKASPEHPEGSPTELKREPIIGQLQVSDPQSNKS
jgi:two-component system phosphate regulon sensor histidine kinase PhoR